MEVVTRTNTHLRMVPKPKDTPKLTADQIVNQVAEHTFEATSYAWFTARDRPVSDVPIERFMTALYRVTDKSEALWEPLVMAYVAPVIYALDAELDAQATGQKTKPEILQRAIREAQAAALASLRADV